MSHQVLMPKFGNNVESCLLSEWLKKEGDRVSKGEIICRVETEKAVFDVESPGDGTLLKIYAEPNSDVPVSSLIAFLGGPEDPIPSTIQVSGGHTKKQTDESILQSTIQASGGHTKEQIENLKPVSAVSNTISVSSEDSNGKISPRAQRLAEKNSINTTGLRGSGPNGRIIERDILAADAGKQPLSPLAAERMRDGDYALPSSGSGPGGRILSTDLTTTEKDSTETPVRGIRKIIAERMRQSMTHASQCTLHSSASASALLALRQAFKSREQFENITINDIVLFLVSRTLRSYPDMNAHFTGIAMRRFNNVHLGFAVDTEKGLLVPVIRNADRLSLKDLSSEAKRLGRACQDGKALPDELSGSTFSITNLGSLGIEMFTPILNYPETAILGICNIIERPMKSADGKITMAPFLGLSLTFNHEAVDGAPAARFLKAVAEAIAGVNTAINETDNRTT